MTLHQMEIFAAIVEAGSFSKAATKLYVAQPSLSQQMRSLEEELGERLLFRMRNKRMHVTEAGEVFKKHSDHILRQVQILRMEMSGLAKNPSGNIRVGIGGYQLTGLLAAAFLRFHKTFPNIRIDIVNETTPRILEQLKNNLLDVGVGTLLANVADLPTEILFEEELVVIVQKKSAFRKRLLITPAEVGQLGLVLYDKSTGTREYLDEFFRREKITPRIVVELSSAEAMLQLVKAGFGATIIPKSAAHETYECLRALRIKGKPLARQTCVVTTSFPRMPQVINTLVQLIRNCFMKEPTAMESGFSRQSRQAYGLPGETAATRFPT